MSKKIQIHANQGAKYKDFFIATWETKEISEELYKELKETRFFRHKILVEVKETTTKKDTK